ncbi:AI-2E family transporter, partial [Candidatus Parcubacteria bacterium]|nr:AI-2E family transporter [Candidatus Parcubacteria bacterium]
MNFSPKIQLEISWDSLFKIFIFGILVYVLFLIREILVWFFLALIISILFNPAINFFTKRKIPRTLSAIFVYFVFFSFLFFVFYYISLPLLSEIQKFGQTFPENFGKISPFLNKLGIISFETFQELTQNLQNWLLKSSKNIAGAISVLFGSFFATLSIISLAIFLSIEEEPLEKIFPFYFGKKADWFLEIWKEIKEVNA